MGRRRSRERRDSQAEGASTPTDRRGSCTLLVNRLTKASVWGQRILEGGRSPRKLLRASSLGCSGAIPVAEATYQARLGFGPGPVVAADRISAAAEARTRACRRA